MKRLKRKMGTKKDNDMINDDQRNLIQSSSIQEASSITKYITKLSITFKIKTLNTTFRQF